MACLEFLIRADDRVADLDLFECVHVKHAELQYSILGQSLPRSCLEGHVKVVLRLDLV